MQGEGKHFLLRICILGVIQTSAGTRLYNKFIYFKVTWGRVLRELTGILNNTWYKSIMGFLLKQNADVNLHVSSERETHTQRQSNRQRESVVTNSWFLSEEFSSQYERQASRCSTGSLLVIFLSVVIFL